LFRGSGNINLADNLSAILAEGVKTQKPIQYQDIFQNLPIPALALNLRNQVIVCNEEFERFSGYNLKEIIGQDLIDIVIPHDAIKSAKFLFSKLLLGEKVKDKQLIKIKDGSVCEVVVNGIPLLQKEDQVGVLIILNRLFTAENDFSQDFERLKRLNEISQLVGAIGHELRNPLCIIKNSAYLVEKQLKGNDCEENKKYLAIIRREAEIGNKIIANLLHFIRKREPQREWIDPMKPIKEIMMRYPLPMNITLNLKNNSQGIQILVDPDQLEVVILNLITNAVHAMPTGGKIEISLNVNDNRFVYQVADTGCGIPSEELSRIFQPFFTSHRNGIGLGLTICKQLVEANQGKISVQSKEGIGTSFNIEFACPMQA
jgi:PAS domain S-box-containing protein